MTKEELIALSDLNREDNIKYISSEAQGIAIALDSDRYAPTLCKLERAYICGRRKSEKQIQIDAEQIRALQKQNGELTDELTKKSDTNHQLVEQLAKLNERCSELEAQIEKMKNCFNCAKGDWNDRVKCIKSGCVNKDKWEIKEK